MPNPIVTISGKLIDRSGGETGLSAPGSREIVEAFPPWPQFIMSFTGWQRVEPGTLTLDDCEPLPGDALQNVTNLEVESPHLLDNFRPDYGRFLRERRGLRRYYGAVVRTTAGHAVNAIVSQQEHPAKADRLEIYSFVRLRDVLALKTGDAVRVEIYSAAVWREHFSGGA